MARIPFRMQQFVVSTIGALLLLPVDFFFGGMFTIAFSAQQSLWAWAFGLTAFWNQALGILASFIRPRLGGAWMLVNIAISMAIRLAMGIGNAAGFEDIHRAAMEYLHAAPAFAKTAGLFWLAPLVLALLLLRKPVPERAPAQTRRQEPAK